jgi:hypothetical protein
MRKNLALLICVGVAVSSSHMHAITGWGRLKHMLGWSATVGAVVYGFQGLEEKSFDAVCRCPFGWSKDGLSFTSKNCKQRVKIASAPAILTAVSVAWMTSHYTPSYRFDWALKELNNLKKRVLFNYSVKEKNIKEISVAAGAESSGLPLVAVFLELAGMDKKLTELISELEIALKDTGASSSLGIQISNLLDQLHVDRVRIRESEYVVKNVDPEAWAKQWEIHNGNQMKEKEIAAMKEIASKPQLHFQHHSTGVEGLATSLIAQALTR